MISRFDGFGCRTLVTPCGTPDTEVGAIVFQLPAMSFVQSLVSVDIGTSRLAGDRIPLAWLMTGPIGDAQLNAFWVESSNGASSPSLLVSPSQRFSVLWEELHGQGVATSSISFRWTPETAGIKIPAGVPVSFVVMLLKSTGGTTNCFLTATVYARQHGLDGYSIPRA